jgi:hypothetical protein
MTSKQPTPTCTTAEKEYTKIILKNLVSKATLITKQNKTAQKHCPIWLQYIILLVARKKPTTWSPLSVPFHSA